MCVGGQGMRKDFDFILCDSPAGQSQRLFHWLYEGTKVALFHATVP